MDAPVTGMHKSSLAMFLVLEQNKPYCITCLLNTNLTSICIFFH